MKKTSGTPFMVLDVYKAPNDPTAVKTGEQILAENNVMRKALEGILTDLRIQLVPPYDTIRLNRAEVEALAKDCEKALSGEGRKPAGGLDFGSELYSLYRLAFGLYDRLAEDFTKYNLVMTALERGSVKALRDLSYNIYHRIDEMIDYRKKKDGAIRAGTSKSRRSPSVIPPRPDIPEDDE